MFSATHGANTDLSGAIDGSTPLRIRLHHLRAARRLRPRTALLNITAVIAVAWVIIAVAIGMHG